jgi:hypothetical protein
MDLLLSAQAHWIWLLNDYRNAACTHVPNMARTASIHAMRCALGTGRQTRAAFSTSKASKHCCVRSSVKSAVPASHLFALSFAEGPVVTVKFTDPPLWGPLAREQEVLREESLIH